jgi:hypothetical protein
MCGSAALFVEKLRFSGATLNSLEAAPQAFSLIYRYFYSAALSFSGLTQPLGIEVD